MLKHVLASLGLLTAFNVQAGSAAAPQPTASPIAKSAPAPAKSSAPRHAVAPTMSVMSVTRQADGTLAANCVQRPNPKAHTKLTGEQP
jgi:hypothetical protein